MKVLMLAPHSFYQDRGTPIAVDLLLRALSERGDEVHLLTFHEGEDRQHPGLTLHRVRPWFSVRDIGPGFSVKKLWCDVFLFAHFWRLLRNGHYDVVHAVEESAFMALSLCPWRSIPFIYDMDSSMATQLMDRFPLLYFFRPFLRFCETLPMRWAWAVVPVCEALAKQAYPHCRGRIVVLQDISLLDLYGSHEPAPDVRTELGIIGKVVMYMGNLEAYQGIDLLLEAFAACRSGGKDAHLVIIGGSESHIAAYRGKARLLGVAESVHFLGPRPIGQMAGFLRQADILVSPRVQGDNTPMKIYSYLHTGRAVLATRLPTHTQIMDDEMALLAEPEPLAFAQAMARLLDDELLRAGLGEHARARIEAEHSYASFRARIHALYDELEQERSADGQNADQ